MHAVEEQHEERVRLEKSPASFVLISNKSTSVRVKSRKEKNETMLHSFKMQGARAYTHHRLKWDLLDRAKAVSEGEVLQHDQLVVIEVPAPRR